MKNKQGPTLPDITAVQKSIQQVSDYLDQPHQIYVCVQTGGPKGPCGIVVRVYRIGRQIKECSFSYANCCSSYALMEAVIAALGSYTNYNGAVLNVQDRIWQRVEMFVASRRYRGCSEERDLRNRMQTLLKSPSLTIKLYPRDNPPDQVRDCEPVANRLYLQACDLARLQFII